MQIKIDPTRLAELSYRDQETSETHYLKCVVAPDDQSYDVTIERPHERERFTLRNADLNALLAVTSAVELDPV